MINAFYLFIALVLLLLNALFVAAEFGMVKLRHTQIQKLKETFGVRGKILARIHQHLDTYLSACQLGITLASLGLGWIGEPAFAVLLAPLFQILDIQSPDLVKLISFGTAFSLLSFLHIVIGELMPKSFAIRQPEVVSLWTAIPLYVFYWLMFPIIWVLNACSNIMLALIKLNKTPQSQHYSTDEIKLILTSSHLHGELTQDETKIIEHTLEFADLNVTEVMRPREEMITLDIQKPIDQLLQIILDNRYSRYPVCERDEVIGIIHIKDLFIALYKDGKITDLRIFIRPILKVSHRLPALNLLKKFRKGITHFALIYKNKTLIGFITLDNLLQILFGRIRDEFHKTKTDWTENEDGSLTFRGDASIYSLERALDRDIDYEGEEEIYTLSGLIFQKLGTFPKVGQRIKFDDFEVVIEKRQGARIQVVRIYPLKEE